MHHIHLNIIYMLSLIKLWHTNDGGFDVSSNWRKLVSYMTYLVAHAKLITTLLRLLFKSRIMFSFLILPFLTNNKYYY
jgi:hypothetical protein